MITRKKIMTLLILLALCGCSVNISENELKDENTDIDDAFLFDDDELLFDDSEDVISGTLADVSSDATYIKLDNQNTSVEGNGVVVSENKVLINSGGTYVLSGAFEGQIYIDASSSAKVNLHLNGVKITNNDASVFAVKANAVSIYLVEGSINAIYDTDNSDPLSSTREASGAIYSKADLTFDGMGKLIVNTLFNDAICGKDNVVFKNGVYEIVSEDDGIVGKDSLIIENGTYNVKSGGDSLKASNDIDASLGYILISNGTFNLISLNDGIQAETSLTINNGNFKIETSGDINSVSSKGLKAKTNLIVNNGNFNLKATDDAIHANNDVTIKKGNFDLSSGDDGIHADNNLVVDDGIINILNAYEGLEADNITINNGTINIYASDDGINVSGGVDGSGNMQRPNKDTFANTSNKHLLINGGTIYVNAEGDGIDSNGNITITNGQVIVEGPTNSSNGALDYDGTFDVNGGTLLAIGASGMTQAPSLTSTINSLVANATASLQEITILNSNNDVIFTFKPTKSFSSIVYTSSDLITNEVYSIMVGSDELGSMTLSSSVNYLNGNSMNGRPNDMNEKPQGGGGGEKPHNKS